MSWLEYSNSTIVLLGLSIIQLNWLGSEYFLSNYHVSSGKEKRNNKSFLTREKGVKDLLCTFLLKLEFRILRHFWMVYFIDASHTVV